MNSLETSPLLINYSLSAEPIVPCSTLTDDLLGIIFNFLGIKHLCTAALVSREWYVKSSSDAIWRGHANLMDCKLMPFKDGVKNLLILNTINDCIREHLSYIRSELYFDPEVLHDSCDPPCHFFCKLVESLFKKNIYTFKKTRLENGIQFHLTLNKVRQINFENCNIVNLRIPKNVSFIIESPNILNHPRCLTFTNKLQESIQINYSEGNQKPFFCRSIKWIERSCIQFAYVTEENFNKIEAEKIHPLKVNLDKLEGKIYTTFTHATKRSPPVTLLNFSSSQDF